MKILGIDFGTKRIGVAISNEAGDFAFPVSVVKNDKEAISTIVNMIKKDNIELLVMGESKNFKMEENKIMEETREFADLLTKETGLEVVYEPEFLTSHQAHHFQGKTDMLDASAATIILQSYLDRRKHETRNV